MRLKHLLVAVAAPSLAILHALAGDQNGEHHVRGPDARADLNNDVPDAVTTVQVTVPPVVVVTATTVAHVTVTIGGSNPTTQQPASAMSSATSTNGTPISQSSPAVATSMNGTPISGTPLSSATSMNGTPISGSLLASATSMKGTPISGSVTSLKGTPVSGSPLASATSMNGTPISGSSPDAFGWPTIIPSASIPRSSAPGTVNPSVSVAPTVVPVPVGTQSSITSAASTGGGGGLIPPPPPPPVLPPPPPPPVITPGGPGGEGQPTNPPTSQPTNEPSSQSDQKTSSTPSSSSSCTTIAATYVSVFCSVTTTAPSGPNGPPLEHPQQGETTPECSTLAYTTVTGCSVTASATTTTSTATVTPALACGVDTCGAGGTCGIGANIHVAPRRRTEPLPGQWSDPANYRGDASAFMRGECAIESQYPESSVVLGMYYVTYNYFAFGNQPMQMTVTGLYGCISIVALSRKAAWMSHIYENPLFTEDWPQGVDPAEQFQDWVLDGIDVSTPNGHDQPYVNDSPLGEFRHGAEDLFAAETNPRILVLSPRNPVFRSNGQPDDRPNAGSDNNLEYADKVALIVQKLQQMFPNVPIRSQGYVRVNSRDPAVLEDRDWNSHRGKLLVQYQPAPAASCDRNGRPRRPGIARYRLWIEGRADPFFHDEWQAEPGVQQYEPEPEFRQADACPLPSSSSVSYPSPSFTATPVTESPSSPDVTAPASSSTTTTYSNDLADPPKTIPKAPKTSSTTFSNDLADPPKTIPKAPKTTGLE